MNGKYTHIYRYLEETRKREPHGFPTIPISCKIKSFSVNQAWEVYFGLELNLDNNNNNENKCNRGKGPSKISASQTQGPTHLILDVLFQLVQL